MSIDIYPGHQWASTYIQDIDEHRHTSRTFPVVALSLEVEPSPKAERKRGNNVEAANLPPAKRKSRVKLTYCEAQENISNIKRVTRSSKIKKYQNLIFIIFFVYYWLYRRLLKMIGSCLIGIKSEILKGYVITKLWQEIYICGCS